MGSLPFIFARIIIHVFYIRLRDFIWKRIISIKVIICRFSVQCIRVQSYEHNTLMRIYKRVLHEWWWSCCLPNTRQCCTCTYLLVYSFQLVTSHRFYTQCHLSIRSELLVGRSAVFEVVVSGLNIFALECHEDFAIFRSSDSSDTRYIQGIQFKVISRIISENKASNGKCFRQRLF